MSQILVYVYTSNAFNDIGDLKRSNKTVSLEGSDEQINIDYDENGKVIGIEILDAQRITSELS